MLRQKSKTRFVAILSCLLMLVSIIVPSTLTASNVSAATFPTTETVKIMPLGDSITDCDFWRTSLFTKLTDNGYNVESVGSQYGNHEGHSGMLVTDLAQTTNLSTWLSSANPDVVMMLFGTNDCWCDKGATAILNAYTTLVGQMRENNPTMTIVVGMVTPLYPNFTSDYVYRVVELDTAMVDWAAEMTTEESPIILCDQFTGFDALTDTYDGCHPNTTGSEKMTENWYETLSAVLDGREAPSVTAPVVTPSETTSVEPSEVPVTTESTSEVPATEATVSEVPSDTPATTTPAASDALQLTAETNAWSTGFTMNCTITNTSDVAVNDWQLVIQKSDFAITNMWCANYTESSDNYIITPQSWNQSISAGENVTFGFQGTGAPAADFEYTLVDPTAVITPDTTTVPTTVEPVTTTETAVTTEPAATTETTITSEPTATTETESELNVSDVLLVGRFDTSDPAGPKFAWSNSTIKANFQGTGIRATLTSAGDNFFDVLIDGTRMDKIEVTAGTTQTISLASGLTDEKHTVELVRRTEAFVGETQFLGFTVTDGELLEAPAASDKRILFIGDSITCGYGIEGTTQYESFTNKNENSNLAYGAVAARELGADNMTISWSGKGVCQNYGGDTDSELMPELYDQMFPYDSETLYDSSEWTPQVVVINLGTNDFSTVQPTKESFVTAYTEFVNHIRSQYPDAVIYCAVGPMLSGEGLASCESYTSEIVDTMNAAGDSNVKYIEFAQQDMANGLGEDWHPSIKTHQIMADQLVAQLQEDMGW